MQKKVSVTGIVEIPSDIANLVLDDNPAEFRKTKNYQFHQGECCYSTQACLNYGGRNYVIAKQIGSLSLCIGYIGKDTAPDVPTQRKIRKIISEKYFGDKTNRNPSYTRIFDLIVI